MICRGDGGGGLTSLKTDREWCLSSLKIDKGWGLRSLQIGADRGWGLNPRGTWESGAGGGGGVEAGRSQAGPRPPLADNRRSRAAAAPESQCAAGSSCRRS